MRDTAPPPDRPRSLWGRSSEVVWLAFAAANFVVMILWPVGMTIPTHFIWISLALLYGFRIWRLRKIAVVLTGVMAAIATAIALGPSRGVLLWSQMLSIPLMATMFMTMVWHARRRAEAQTVVEQRAEDHRLLLARQERFVHDASHELRTPVTIVRGHLELLEGRIGHTSELAVAIDELSRIDAITERLLVLSAVDQPDFLLPVTLELEPLLEDVFMRWSEVAPRSWRLGPLAEGSLVADADRLRVALDALIENAVKYAPATGVIELRARRHGISGVTIEVLDEGPGVPPESRERIFERFARADPARTRAEGGVGLGLAIVDAIARAHGGRASVTDTGHGTAFALHLPQFTPSGTSPRGDILETADQTVG